MFFCSSFKNSVYSVPTEKFVSFEGYSVASDLLSHCKVSLVIIYFIENKQIHTQNKHNVEFIIIRKLIFVRFSKHETMFHAFLQNAVMSVKNNFSTSNK